MPVGGATLLHLAVEYQNAELAKWLIEQGADVNARAAVDDDGFGGHTPLFHTVVTPFKAGGAEPARILLSAGADPNIRTTIRKQLRGMGDAEKEAVREFHNVTPVEFARNYQEAGWINDQAIRIVEQFDNTGS